MHLASLLERIGECTRFQGHFQDAGRCFEKALELHRQTYPSLSSLPDQEKIQEAQIQAEAELLQAHISLFLDSIEEALRQASYVLESANRHELKWIAARAELLVEELLALQVLQQNENA